MLHTINAKIDPKLTHLSKNLPIRIFPKTLLTNPHALNIVPRFERTVRTRRSNSAQLSGNPRKPEPLAFSALPPCDFPQKRDQQQHCLPRDRLLVLADAAKMFLRLGLGFRRNTYRMSSEKLLPVSSMVAAGSEGFLEVLVPTLGAAVGGGY